jgi:hypothetical protein
MRRKRALGITRQLTLSKVERLPAVLDVKSVLLCRHYDHDFVGLFPGAQADMVPVLFDISVTIRHLKRLSDKLIKQ